MECGHPHHACGVQNHDCMEKGEGQDVESDLVGRDSAQTEELEVLSFETILCEIVMLELSYENLQDPLHC